MNRKSLKHDELVDFIDNTLLPDVLQVFSGNKAASNRLKKAFSQMRGLIREAKVETNPNYTVSKKAENEKRKRSLSISENEEPTRKKSKNSMEHTLHSSTSTLPLLAPRPPNYPPQMQKPMPKINLTTPSPQHSGVPRSPSPSQANTSNSEATNRAASPSPIVLKSPTPPPSLPQFSSLPLTPHIDLKADRPIPSITQPQLPPIPQLSQTSTPNKSSLSQVMNTDPTPNSPKPTKIEIL